MFISSHRVAAGPLQARVNFAASEKKPAFEEQFTTVLERCLTLAQTNPMAVSSSMAMLLFALSVTDTKQVAEAFVKKFPDSGLTPEELERSLENSKKNMGL
jgi:hypothetical protein